MSLDDALAAERDRRRRRREIEGSQQDLEAANVAAFRRLAGEFVTRAREQMEAVPAGYWKWRSGGVFSKSARIYRWEPLGLVGWLIDGDTAVLDDGRLVVAEEVLLSQRQQGARAHYRYLDAPPRTLALNVAFERMDQVLRSNTRFEITEAPIAELERLSTPDFEAHWLAVFARVLARGTEASAP